MGVGDMEGVREGVGVMEGVRKPSMRRMACRSDCGVRGYRGSIGVGSHAQAALKQHCNLCSPKCPTYNQHKDPRRVRGDA